MRRFDYEILVPFNDVSSQTGVGYIVSSTDLKFPGKGLLTYLKEAGALGWEIVAIGDLGFSGRNEIVLKRETP